jgi:hypothetical protein
VFRIVERCMDVVGDESLLIVDMIFCYGETLEPLFANPKISEVTFRVSRFKRYDSPCGSTIQLTHVRRHGASRLQSRCAGK